MPSLHIEHPITDLATWLAAFTRFADVRRQAGVLAEQVRHLAADPAFVVIDLDFTTVDEAEAFLQFLEANVWAVPAISPALAGTPEAQILETVELPAVELAR